MNVLDKGMIHVHDVMGQDGQDFINTAKNGARFKTQEFSI